MWGSAAAAAFPCGSGGMGALVRFLAMVFLGVSGVTAESSGSKVCDAINVCPGGTCPAGMELVGPPLRSAVYRVETDAPTYTPGALVPIRIKVTQPQIASIRNAGKPQCPCTGRRCPGGAMATVCDCDLVQRQCTVDQANPILETSKYLGLLMYAVKANDPSEEKVGSWEIPSDGATPRFAAMEGEGCEGKALVQTSASAKRFTERFWFRAPPAATGPLVFRVLLKQGDTLGGSFYWPSTGNGDAPPQNGVSGGDLQMAEAPSTAQALRWVSGAAGQSCSDVCTGIGRTCDAPSFAAAASVEGLLSRVATTHVCAPPLLSSCEPYAPSASGLGDGWCWFADPSACGGAAPTSQCDVSPAANQAERSGHRFCPCGSGGGGRRQMESQPNAVARARAAAGGNRTKEESAAVRDGCHFDHSKSGGASLPSGERGAPPVHASTHPGGRRPVGCPFASAAMATATATAATKPAAAATGASTETAAAAATTASIAHPRMLAASAEPAAAARRLRLPSLATASLRALALPATALGALAILASFAAIAVRRAGALHRRPRPRTARATATGTRWLGTATRLLATTWDVPYAEAHNWINSPQSRATKASTVTPCLPRADSTPHVRANPDQDFLVEWASGHPGSDHFFVVLKATDAAMMSRHSEAMLNEYVAGAPAAPYMEGARYRKMHYGWTATSRAGGDEPQHSNYIAQGLVEVAATAPEFAPRPGAFACASFGSVKGTWETQDCEQVGDLKLYNYPAAAHASDARVAYANPKYPWIEAVHRFKAIKPTADKNGYPKQFDTARFSIPARGGTGDYIVQYYWRGCAWRRPALLLHRPRPPRPPRCPHTSATPAHARRVLYARASPINCAWHSMFRRAFMPCHPRGTVLLRSPPAPPDRDCIDVAVLPATTPVAPTSREMYLSLQADTGGVDGGGVGGGDAGGEGGGTGGGTPITPIGPPEYNMVKTDQCARADREHRTPHRAVPRRPRHVDPHTDLAAPRRPCHTAPLAVAHSVKPTQCPNHLAGVCLSRAVASTSRVSTPS